MTSPMGYQIEHLGQMLNDASRALRRRFEERTAHHGLSATQWRLLAQIYRMGPMTQVQLADRLDVEPMSVSRLIDRMEAAGWVRRVEVPGDRRARMVCHTEKAAACADEVMRIARGVYAEALAPLSEDHRRILHDALVVLTGAAAPLSCQPDAAQKGAAAAE